MVALHTLEEAGDVEAKVGGMAGWEVVGRLAAEERVEVEAAVVAPAMGTPGGRTAAERPVVVAVRLETGEDLG